jgi:hypothetical protein
MSCTNCGNLGSNCSCSDNCPNKASDITVFDCNTFNVLEVPCDATLCDVLGLLEQYTTNMVTELDTMTSVVIGIENCIGLEPGTYGIQQVIDAILNKICSEPCPLFVEINELGEKLLEATVTGGIGPYTYSWSFKDNIGILNFGGATNTSTVDITGTTRTFAFPTCTVNDARGCSSSATFLWYQPGEIVP